MGLSLHLSQSQHEALLSVVAVVVQPLTSSPRDAAAKLEQRVRTALVCHRLGSIEALKNEIPTFCFYSKQQNLKQRAWCFFLFQTTIDFPCFDDPRHAIHAISQIFAGENILYSTSNCSTHMSRLSVCGKNKCGTNGYPQFTKHKSKPRSVCCMMLIVRF